MGTMGVLPPWQRQPETQVLVTMKSQLTGRVHTRQINVDEDALWAYLDGVDPRPVQVCFPHLAPEDREFLITGTTPEEWAECLGPAH